MSILQNALHIRKKRCRFLWLPVYGILTAGIMLPGAAEAHTSPSSCSGAVVVYTTTAPTIDGTVDAAWSKAPANTLSQTISGTIQTGSTWQAMCDASNLYILVQVKDANLSSAGTNVYDQDGVEIFIAGNNSKAGTYTADDHQYRFNWNVTASPSNITGNTNGSTSAITYAIPSVTGGYTLEVSIPWSTIGSSLSIAAGKSLGFDVNINDQQNNSGSREATVGWNGTYTDDFQNTAHFGTVLLCSNIPVISSTTTSSAVVGTAYSYTITASNSPTSYGASGLPSGLSVNTSTGAITGTPTTAGSYTVTIQATNSDGTGSQTLTIIVSGAPLSSLNGLTAASQVFKVDSTGNDFSITSGDTVHTFSIPTASASKRGLLSAADWSAFNSKADTQRLADTAAALRAAINTSVATASFTTGTAGTDFNIGDTSNAYTFNIPTASAGSRGLLGTADWSSFNGKASISGGTANYVARISNSNTLVNSAIYDNGTNVGIGTTNINDVTYRLFVETGIRTRKVKIDQLTWADYVFDSSYVLPSLTDVEKYIHQHRHLPEVPTAIQVKKEGVDVSDNQALLLKKIEELTLYMIELNKQVKQLSKENEELKDKINQLKQ